VAFADIINAKSRFTAGHSRRATRYTAAVASRPGLSAPHRRWLRREALLHDTGKLTMSNNVVDKPGRLDGRAIRSTSAATLLPMR